MNLKKHDGGEVIDIEQMEYDEACEVFGRGLVELYYEYKNPKPGSRLQVIEVNYKTKTLTLGIGERE